MITQSLLKEFLEYDQYSGDFVWKLKPSGQVKVGSVAGCETKRGYRYIKLFGKKYQAHRLAFLYMTGSIPEVVDHINQDPSDNRWGNLRSCTLVQNGWNRKLSKVNSSGVKGVCWNKNSKRWVANITTGKTKKYLGQFTDLISAELAIKRAREELHGEFANHG